MKYKGEVKNKPFRTWYQGLPKNKVVQAREEIMKHCNIKYPVFYRWLSGQTPIPFTAYLIINKIAGIKVFEVDEPSPILEDVCQN